MDLNVFDRLEEKIEELLVQFESIKKENQELRADLAEKETRIATLSERLDQQENERSQVRQRIEQLILKLES